MKKTALLPLLLVGFIALLSMSLSGCDGNSTAQSSTNSIAAPDLDLHAATAMNNLEVITQHIEAGSDLNVKDPMGGSSPLITAALFGHAEAAQLLIDAGAKLDFQNNDGSTALHTAAFFCRTEVVNLLIKAGADKSIVNKYGDTPQGSVSAPYEAVEGVYKMMAQQLKPMGLVVDFQHIRNTRPQLAELLK